MTPPPEPKLLPCPSPCCNGVVKIEGACLNSWMNNLAIICIKCGSEFANGRFKSESDLIAWWNTRPTPSAASGEVDEVRIDAIAVKAAKKAQVHDIHHREYVDTIKQAILEATKDLMEDKKRLDWLEAAVKKTDSNTQLIKLDEGLMVGDYRVVTYNGKTTSEFSNESLRTAISTAMEGK